jgi:hypothetical protein
MFEKIIQIYPTLTSEDFHPNRGTILLQDDGKGVYIADWNHPTLEQPTEEQLAE